MTANKKITPTDLRKQAQQLLKSGQMPSLEQVFKAVSETRRKYRPLIVSARNESKASKE